MASDTAQPVPQPVSARAPVPGRAGPDFGAPHRPMSTCRRSPRSSTAGTPTCATWCATTSRARLDPRRGGDLPREDFRERVLEVVEMAATGQTGFGFPKEYGGGGDIGASIAAFETLAYGDLSVRGQGRRPVRAVRRRDPAARHAAAPRRLPRRPDHGRLLGCFAMTETGHGSQRAGARHHRDLRRRRAVSSSSTPRTTAPARTTSATPRGTPSWRWCSPSSCSAVTQRTGVHAFVVPIRDEQGAAAARRPHRGLTASRSASTASTTAGCGSTACGCRAPTCSTATPWSPTDGRYFSDIENPDRRFFTMLGTLVQGRVCVGGAGHQRLQGRAGDRDRATPVRRRQFEPTSGPDEEELLLDYGMHQRRLFPLLARTYALHFAQERVAADLHEVFSGRRRRRAAELAARSSRGPPAPRRWAPGTRPARSRSAARRAAAPATCRSTGSTRCKADTDVFTTFEGDNTC